MIIPFKSEVKISAPPYTSQSSLAVLPPIRTDSELHCIPAYVAGLAILGGLREVTEKRDSKKSQGHPRGDKWFMAILMG